MRVIMLYCFLELSGKCLRCVCTPSCMFLTYYCVKYVIGISVKQRQGHKWSRCKGFLLQIHEEARKTSLCKCRAALVICVRVPSSAFPKGSSSSCVLCLTWSCYILTLVIALYVLNFQKTAQAVHCCWLACAKLFQKLLKLFKSLATVAALHVLNFSKSY